MKTLCFAKANELPEPKKSVIIGAMSDTKTTVKSYIVGLLLLAAGTLSLFYWGGKKQVWFCDEIYTYESANGFEQEWPASHTDTWMSGRDVEAFFAADRDTLSLGDITVRLYNDHVPLYFWLFRTVSLLFFRGSGTIWIGLAINLLFYLIFLGLCYTLFLRLLKNPLTVGAILLLTCVVNLLMVEHITVLRMYMMLLLSEAMLLSGGYWILRECRKNRWSPAPFCYLFIVSVFGFLTHYDYWIFYAATSTPFCLWLLLKAFREKRGRFFASTAFKYVLAWAGCFILALLTTIWLFPYCRWNLNRGKGQMALRSLVDFSGEKFGQILWGYRRLSGILFGDALPAPLGLFLLFGCIAGGGILLYRKKECEILAGLILTVVTTQLYQLVVCFTMPAGLEERYLWGEFVILGLCAAFGAALLLQACFSRIKDKGTGQIIRWAVGVILFATLLIGEISILDGGRNVAYLFQQGKNVDLLRENSQIPWVVFGPAEDVYSYYDWMIPEKICFLSQDGTAEEMTAIKELGDKPFVLYVYEKDLSESIFRFEAALGRDLEASYLTGSTNYSVYLVE